MEQVDIAPTQLPEKADSPTKSVVESWWQRKNIVERLLGPKENPNKQADTLPAGAD